MICNNASLLGVKLFMTHWYYIIVYINKDSWHKYLCELDVINLVLRNLRVGEYRNLCRGGAASTQADYFMAIWRRKSKLSTNNDLHYSTPHYRWLSPAGSQAYDWVRRLRRGAWSIYRDHRLRLTLSSMTSLLNWSLPNKLVLRFTGFCEKAD